MFPRLPLLGLIEQRAKQAILKECSLVAVQHLLTETGSLIEAAMRLGLPKDRILALGKTYSSSQKVARYLTELGVHAEIPNGKWQLGKYSEVFEAAIGQKIEAHRKVVCRDLAGVNIVLDDGGFCIGQIARGRFRVPHAVGIEQTTSGVARIAEMHLRFPVIAVATSCAKRFIEPPIVLRAAEDKLNRRLKHYRKLRKIGVVGLGNIGYEIAGGLASQRNELFVHDKNWRLQEQFLSDYPNACGCVGVVDLVNQADLVFGCTGSDILPRTCWGSLAAGIKVLVSCSSGDVEFQDLLRSRIGKHRKSADPFSPVDLRIGDAALTILEGGFPITFDRTPVSAPLRDMQMTRALLLGAMIQAVVCADQRETASGGVEMLHPSIQKFVVAQWLKLNPARRKDYPANILRNLNDEIWIRGESQGDFVDSRRLRDMFHY